MVNTTDATGGCRDDLPPVEAALNMVERQREASIARAHAMHARRVRMIEVLFAGGSMRALARELGLSPQTIRCEVDRLEERGIRVPRRPAPIAYRDQERLPVG